LISGEVGAVLTSTSQHGNLKGCATHRFVSLLLTDSEYETW